MPISPERCPKCGATIPATASQCNICRLVELEEDFNNQKPLVRTPHVTFEGLLRDFHLTEIVLRRYRKANEELTQQLASAEQRAAEGDRVLNQIRQAVQNGRIDEPVRGRLLFLIDSALAQLSLPVAEK